MRLTNDQYYLSLLAGIAARSTCARRKVGAVIVDRDHRVLSMGFNGVPSGFQHCIDIPCPGASDTSGDTRRCEAVHAEMNAILTCMRLDLAHTLYVSCSPCRTCALVIANTRVQRIVCMERYSDNASEILERAGIALEIQ